MKALSPGTTYVHDRVETIYRYFVRLIAGNKHNSRQLTRENISRYIFVLN